MKNRKKAYNSDHWETPMEFYRLLDKKYHFDFDPCPLHNSVENWDGLKGEWKERNFINPPYSLDLKRGFVEKAVQQAGEGKLCVLLIPASTSTKLFHEVIMPNAFKIFFVKGRIRFRGINSKGQKVNYHIHGIAGEATETDVKNAGQHDSMVVELNKGYLKKPLEIHTIPSR